ncbi:unannotated protein [freshwater metagenome]|uniref:Unannotated protein n=1 Tax=freshwater metagenome TaxID=449393 RepID=A0A6J6U2T2_9ZZZZ
MSANSIPIGSARVASTASVCGWVSASTAKTFDSLFELRRSNVMASAAAVDSSSSDALAISNPVKSVTIVWKLIKASRRPWEISGWYGVYAVYQAGFSVMFRKITPGVCVP